MDFRTVAVRGPRVWIAGQPGSVIWHSPDGGKSWTRQFTGQTVPIQAIAFSDDDNGCAVGAMGMILKTVDGGRTWQAVRGGKRRAALLAGHAHAGRVSYQLLAKESAERGYRSVVLLPARRDIGPDGHAHIDQDLRLHEAVIAAGGSAGEIEWQFPIAIPGLDGDREKLIENWDRLTDGRLREVFLGRLVCRLRTWRPSVVIIDQPPPGDETTDVLTQGITQAIEEAADPTRHSQLQSLAGLGPWQVDKLLVRLPKGSTGELHVKPHEFLPRLRKSVHQAAGTALGLMIEGPEQTALREAYKAVLDHTHTGTAQRATHDFFGGLRLYPGSDARRPLAVYDDRGEEDYRKLVEKQRNFSAYAEEYLNDPRHGSQIIAKLSYITAGLEHPEAALQLVQLADRYRALGQWDLVEATYVELVSRYPDEAVSLTAMQWLLQLWVGAEPAWQRIKGKRVNRRELSQNQEQLFERVQNAVAAANSGDANRGPGLFDSGPDPIGVLDRQVTLKVGPGDNWRRGTVGNWHNQAVKMASLIRKKSPRFYRTPGVQFPVATLLRQRGKPRLANGVYRRQLQSPIDDPWRKTADAELWLGTPHTNPPKKPAYCRPAAAPPYLDGLLSDPCWGAAEEISLTHDGDQADTRGGGFCLLLYDANYLYFAASIPRVAGTPADRPILKGRQHDADIAKFDRVRLLLDVDRDYSTYYTFSVDQRGWTSESCWEDTTWNPAWSVAAAADETHWRIEVAIPFENLVPEAPRPGAVWAVDITRTIPGIRLESYTHPSSGTPRPESFGLLRFD
jgi:hypothetical protein